MLGSGWCLAQHLQLLLARVLQQHSNTTHGGTAGVELQDHDTQDGMLCLLVCGVFVAVLFLQMCACWHVILVPATELKG
jgi:hypothetical protein